MREAARGVRLLTAAALGFTISSFSAGGWSEIHAQGTPPADPGHAIAEKFSAEADRPAREAAKLAAQKADKARKLEAERRRTEAATQEANVQETRAQETRVQAARVQATKDAAAKAEEAEMLATARIERMLGGGVVIPAQAVSLRGATHSVLVQVQPGVFETREVQLSYQGPHEAVHG